MCFLGRAYLSRKNLEAATLLTSFHKKGIDLFGQVRLLKQGHEEYQCVGRQDSRRRYPMVTFPFVRRDPGRSLQ